MARQKKPAPKKPAASDQVTMPKDEFKAEHERLLGVLKSPSHADDRAEYRKQSAEMKRVLKPAPKRGKAANSRGKSR